MAAWGVMCRRRSPIRARSTSIGSELPRRRCDATTEAPPSRKKIHRSGGRWCRVDGERRSDIPPLKVREGAEPHTAGRGRSRPGLPCLRVRPRVARSIGGCGSLPPLPSDGE